MIVYHGSGQLVDEPEIRKHHYTKDFSWGFYCTNNYKQSVRWATTRRGIPTINYYEYKEDASLNILKFEGMTEKWLDFIARCRNGEVHNYDMVEGPMADDDIWDHVRDYLNGKMSREIFMMYARFKHPTHQVSFHTLRALNTLKFLKSEVVEHDR